MAADFSRTNSSDRHLHSQFCLLLTRLAEIAFVAFTVVLSCDKLLLMSTEALAFYLIAAIPTDAGTP